jgi:electron transport complex protein RnfB
MTEECYLKLAEHLDRLPDGLGTTETGAELRLLQKLFTPLEAELAVCLTLEPSDAQAIARKAGLPLAEVAQRLEEMALKGLILPSQAADEGMLYQAAPLFVGIYEFQVNNMTPDFLEAMHEYWETLKPGPRVQTTHQTRIIPVGQSIDPHLEALPYEQVEALIASQDRFAVAPCICRRHARLTKGSCDAPEESCLVFGKWADFYVRTGRARAIDRAELKAILARADAANLVLQPSNSQDIAFICCCCGCCCGILAGLKRHPRPADVVVSAFIATLDADLCQGCWTCLERCQMDALSEDGDRVALDAGRCIGCGLCVSTCPSGALTLARKPDRARPHVPADLDATWREIARERATARD